MMVSIFRSCEDILFFSINKKDCYHDRFERSYHDF